jgi:hypothetical protein
MARKLKRKPPEENSEWLVGLNLEVTSQVEGSYVEIYTYDHVAPKDRHWTITLTDRESWKTVTMRGEFQGDTRELAYRALGIDLAALKAEES